MLKVMRSNKLKRFIAVLFILLSVFSMCFSVAAKAEAVTVGVGVIVVIGACLTAMGVKFASSADAAIAARQVWNGLSYVLQNVIHGVVSLCTNYQKARVQIPFWAFQGIAAVVNSLFPSSSTTATVVSDNSVSFSNTLPLGDSGASWFYPVASGVPVREYFSKDSGFDSSFGSLVLYNWGYAFLSAVPFSYVANLDIPTTRACTYTQQRKQRKIVIGTSQVFNRVAKPIREQTTFLYEPVTLFGCLTIVRVYKPVVGDDGLAERKLLRRMFFFVHSDELRSSFDTYRKIQNLADSGFKPAADQMRGSGQVIQLQQSPSSGLPLFSKRSR